MKIMPSNEPELNKHKHLKKNNLKHSNQNKKLESNIITTLH